MSPFQYYYTRQFPPPAMSDQTTKIVLCPECSQGIDWPIKNPAGPFCPKCGGLISVVYPQTTNDPQAPYGAPNPDPLKEKQRQLIIQMMRDDEVDGLYDEQPKREPMLSDEQINDPNLTIPLGAKFIRDFYEAKIASGELMVVKTIPKKDALEHIYDCAKMHVMGSTMESVKHCPGCGAKIVEG